MVHSLLSLFHPFQPKARGKMKHLSIVAVVRDEKGNHHAFADEKRLEEQNNPVAMNGEIHRRVQWFINGAAMSQPSVLISVSHSVFEI